MLSLISDSLRFKRPQTNQDHAEEPMVEETRAKIPSHLRQGIEPPSENTYFSTIQQYEASLRRVEEILVNKISVAISMADDAMTTERIEHALHVKQMYTAGEIGFNEYIQKMYNLYPHRMQNLPEDLKQRIEACQDMLRDRVDVIG